MQNLGFTCARDCPGDHFLVAASISLVPIKHLCIRCSVLIEKCQVCLGYRNSFPVRIFCLKCQRGYFPKIDPSSNFEQTCKKCDSGCASCVESPTNCSECITGMVLRFDQQTKEVLFFSLFSLC